MLRRFVAIAVLPLALPACGDSSSGSGPQVLPYDAGSTDAVTEAEVGCRGVPLQCSSHYDHCDNVPGCWDDGSCNGVAWSCSSYDSNLDCIMQSGCSWSYGDDECQGNERSCYSTYGRFDCDQQQGCSWQPSCQGTVVDCLYLPFASCANVLGCYWIGPQPDGGEPQQDGDVPGVGDGASKDATEGDASEPACWVDEDCVSHDDGDLCNGVKRCSGGACVYDPTSVVTCPADEPGGCKTWRCWPATGQCLLQNRVDGAVCNDGTYCTKTDRCKGGVCAGTDSPCTSTCQLCNEALATCAVKPDRCEINGSCYTASQANPWNACEACDPAAPGVWTPKAAGSSCDDKDDCSLSDACNGAASCVGVSSKPPPSPKPHAPASGTRTGSPWMVAPNTNLRPKLRWFASAYDGCALPRYEVQVDDSCDSADLANCTFPSPEAQASGLQNSSWSPDADLPIDLTPPVGRRYYWRVRACRDTSCSAWSRTHYFDAGRVEKDFNGDGRSELIVPISDHQRSFYVFEGTPIGISTSPSVMLGAHNDGYCFAHAGAGDLNGDGFADMVYEHVTTGSRDALVYFGSASGLPSNPSIVLSSENATHSGLSAVGDINADGYDDLVRAAGQGTYYSFEYFPGGPTGPKSPPTLIGKYPDDHILEPTKIQTGGDLDGDCFVDVAVTRSFFNPIIIYRGGESGPSTTSSKVIPYILDSSNDVMQISTAGDIHGDGFADLIAGELSADDNGVGGALYLFKGSVSLPPTQPTKTILNPLAGVTAGFGDAATVASDVNHDGYADVIVGAPYANNFTGRAFVFYGSPSGIASSPDLEISSPAGEFTYFGGHIAHNSDFDGDGYSDIAIAAWYAGMVLIYEGSASGLASQPSAILFGAAGDHSFGERLY